MTALLARRHLRRGVRSELHGRTRFERGLLNPAMELGLDEHGLSVLLIRAVALRNAHICLRRYQAVTVP
jgi:hypothetical protein